jgi:HSP20 family protein
MTNAVTRVPVQTTAKGTGAMAPTEWRPFGALRREMDRLFDDFDLGLWRRPFSESSWLRGETPAVDVAEKDNAYEITAELPGMDQNNIEVKLTNGVLTIKGEKKEHTEEKKKNYYMSERRYGAFERSFQVPDGVDAEKIGATFSKGLLTVSLPKSAEAQKSAKTITVKAA